MVASRHLGLDEFALPGPAASWELGPRGLSANVLLAWAGLRDYEDPENPGTKIRVFRDPQQLRSPKFLATLERMPAAIGHPRNVEGKYLFPCIAAQDPNGEPAPFAADAVLVPFSRIQVGSVGDRIELVDGGEGFLVPQGRVTITEPNAALGTLGTDGSPRKDETSLAFVKHDIRKAGVWVDEKGESHPYDVEQVIDPGDPRVPPDLVKWLGAYYLGICLERGTSRGGMTRIALDAIASRKSSAPRTFYMYRQADESGVSGTGHVLDGVIWPNGKMSFCWHSDTSSVGSFDSYQDFASTHITSHPGNGTIITFDDGAAPPAAPAPPTDLATQDSTNMDPLAQAMAQIEELKKQLEAAKAEIEKLNKANGAASSDATAQAAALEAAKTDAATKAAAVDSLELELKPYREAALTAEIGRVAKIAGIDSKVLIGTKISDLPVAAMREHFRIGRTQAPAAERLADPTYLRARFDILEESGAAVDSDDSADDVSPEFRQAFDTNVTPAAGLDAKNSGKSDKPAIDNSLSDLA